MRSVWAMVCGTIRDQVDFSLMMDYLLRCREKGIIQGIVLTTWTHEFDDLKELEKKLQQNDVAIVMSSPNDEMVANMHSNSINYWRQAKQMQAALDLIPPEAIVLRTRTDRALPATRCLIAMLDEPDPLPLVAEVAQDKNLTTIPREFEHKIAIFKARTGRTLQFTDFAFMGYSADIRKLVNFDVSDFTFNRGLVANTQFFIYPFILDYPVIRDYYRVINFYPLLKDLATYTENDGTHFPKFLERFYAVYFSLLATHFRIGSLLDEEKLGPITPPIEFSDFFHTSQGKNLVHDALGVTLNSQAVLDAFMTQPISSVPQPKSKHWWQKKAVASEQLPAVEQAATKQVLTNIHNVSPSMLGRVTNEELAELKVFADNREFSPQHWLLVTQPIFAEQKQIYQEKIQYSLPGISEEEQAQLWLTCENSQSASRELYRYWLQHDLKPTDSPAYLMSSARTDNRFSITTVTRLLRQGLVDDKDRAEILRINDFFGSFHMRHGSMNAEISSYMLARYMYLVETNQVIPRSADEQAGYVFKRYLPGKFTTFKKLVKKSVELEEFFDAAIAESKGEGIGSRRQRVTEMALEVTHQKKYWQLLKKQFNGRYESYEYAYRYGISWQLI